ncbi:MAG: methionyl-tRNA formyltransferase [Alloprevotella sp.]|nr:methionyl-tRNA formyltransferase [Alloprevotella sp.]
MDKKDLRIIFMGTPEFAVASLARLLEEDFNIVAVVTMPDKPIGRHQDQLSQSAVKKFSLEHKLPVLQPERLKDEAFLKQLQDFRADLQVVVAFRMLPEVVWNMPRFGTYNLHAALLPQYRGAAPINWAIINGEKETGVTTFFLDQDIDTGRIIHQQRIPIAEDDNAEDIHDRLMALGADLVVKTAYDILSGNVETIPQEQLYTSSGELRLAPKIFRETCRIDWSKSAKDLHNFIRGLSPYPAAWTELHQGGSVWNLKLFRTEIVALQPKEPTGTVVINNGKEILISIKDGYLRILELQIAGKRRMKSAEFLNGFRDWSNLSVQ